MNTRKRRFAPPRGWIAATKIIEAGGWLLSDAGPYATPDDAELASELGLTVEQLRAQRAAEDTP